MTLYDKSITKSVADSVLLSLARCTLGIVHRFVEAGRHKIYIGFLLIFRGFVRWWLTLYRRDCSVISVFQKKYQSNEGRRRCRLAENPTIKPSSNTPDPAKNHLIY